MSQHYRFAYGYLKQYAFGRPQQLQEYLQEDSQGFLTWLWAQAAQDGKGEACPGLEAKLFQHEGLLTALITLPPPSKSPEAYFVLLSFSGEPPDFFSLEKAVGEVFPNGTVLGRWHAESRENLGPGPSPNADAFIDHVLTFLKENSDTTP